MNEQEIREIVQEELEPLEKTIKELRGIITTLHNDLTQKIEHIKRSIPRSESGYH